MTPPLLPEKIQTIAKAHRGQTFSILCLVLTAIVVGASETPGLLPEGLTAARCKSIMYAVIVVVWAASLYLGFQSYRGGDFVVIAILAMIPPINLIMWIVINSHATKVLRRAGMKVGLWGADMRTLPTSGTPPPLDA